MTVRHRNPLEQLLKRLSQHRLTLPKTNPSILQYTVHLWTYVRCGNITMNRNPIFSIYCEVLRPPDWQLATPRIYHRGLGQRQPFCASASCVDDDSTVSSTDTRSEGAFDHPVPPYPHSPAHTSIPFEDSIKSRQIKDVWGVCTLGGVEEFCVNLQPGDEQVALRVGGGAGL